MKVFFENSEDGAIVDDSRRDTGADTGGYCIERSLVVALNISLDRHADFYSSAFKAFSTAAFIIVMGSLKTGACPAEPD
jgi:hypothetical protein